VAPQLGQAPYAGVPAPESPFPQVGGLPQFHLPGQETAAPGFEPAGGDAPQISTGAEPVEDDANRVVRILCPNDHELHTPMDMVGTDAMCPQCGVQFRLRYEDSIEYKEQRKAAQQRREQKFAKTALNWAIVASVVIALAIIVMIALRAS
jgi:hypothetical protein